MKNILLALFVIFNINTSLNAASLVGRLGMGFSNHLVSNQQTLSLKLQKTRSTALGGSFGINSSSEGTFYALGGKIYRYIYEEPQLNFYSALGLNMFTYFNDAEDEVEQGHQIDGTFGTEFSFQGLESIGFSFEFGMSINKYEGENRVQTIGQSVIASAIHFYL